MTGATICELGQLFRIICGSRSMTPQTPPHVHHLGILSNLNLGHIAMTGFTVQARSDMRTMDEMNKIRHLCDRHPGNFLVIQNIILQHSKFWTCICLCDLLMTSPAFRECRQPRRRSAQRTRMTIETLYSQPNVQLMRKLDRLCWRLLGYINPKGSQAENGESSDQYSDPPNRLIKPFKNVPEHAYSYGKIISNIMK